VTRTAASALACALLVAAIAGACGEPAAAVEATPLPQAGEPSQALAPQVAAVTRLSDLRTLSRWAYPNSEARVRSAPSAHARTVGHLRFLTSDGLAQLYVALASEHTPSGQTWVRIELPGRPNGQHGWVPRAALGTLHVVRGYLLIDQRDLRATLYRDGRAVFSAPVGVGKPSTVTPAGEFYVTEKLRTVNAPAYGPYALGTSAYAPTLSEWPGGGVVGMHGTNEPQLVPGRPSHGCIRLHDGDMARLWHMIEAGTPIDIT
jgi:hypothetical protein